MLSSGKLLPISKVARLTPYSTEYLSLLARKGKIDAVKISRDWLTTTHAVLNYVKAQKKRHTVILDGLHETERRMQ